MTRLLVVLAAAALLAVAGWKWAGAHPQTHRAAGWTWDDTGALIQDGS